MKKYYKYGYLKNYEEVLQYYKAEISQHKYGVEVITKTPVPVFTEIQNALGDFIIPPHSSNHIPVLYDIVPIADFSKVWVLTNKFIIPKPKIVLEWYQRRPFQPYNPLEEYKQIYRSLYEAQSR